MAHNSEKQKSFSFFHIGQRFLALFDGVRGGDMRADTTRLLASNAMRATTQGHALAPTCAPAKTQPRWPDATTGRQPANPLISLNNRSEKRLGTVFLAGLTRGAMRPEISAYLVSPNQENLRFQRLSNCVRGGI